MQVDPIKPQLKAPGTKRLKLKHDKLLSRFAFKFNLHRYIKVMSAQPIILALANPTPEVQPELVREEGPAVFDFVFCPNSLRRMPKFGLLCSDYAQLCLSCQM